MSTVVTPKRRVDTSLNDVRIEALLPNSPPENSLIDLYLEKVLNPSGVMKVVVEAKTLRDLRDAISEFLEFAGL